MAIYASQPLQVCDPHFLLFTKLPVRYHFTTQTMRPPYIHCPACDRLTLDPDGRLIDGEVPCPECNDTCDVRVWWPYQPDICALLDVIEAHRIIELAEHRVVATVFLASMMEALLEVHLRDVLRRLGTNEKIAELLMDTYQDREQRLTLYNQLAMRPLEDVLASVEMPNFLVAWKKLAEASNGSVHGDWQSGYKLDPDTIKQVRDRCFDAFAAMHEEARSVTSTMTANHRGFR